MNTAGIQRRTRVTLRPIDIDRFWSKVDKSGECWLWTGADRGNGYGVMKVAGKLVSTHCLAFQIQNGAIPAGKIVCHRCDVRACVRGDHLFAGTPHDNVLDMDSKGRSNRVHGEQHGNAKLTEKQVLDVWFLKSLGWTNRRIAASMDVKPQTVDGIIRGDRWRHVSERIGALTS